MRFVPPLVSGRLLGRRKRFFADVRLDDGRTVVAHLPNTGSMRGCSTPGSRCWIAPAAGRGRRLAWTLELVESGGVLVSVNTARTNALVAEALARGGIPPLAGAARIAREVRVGDSRLDFVLERAGRRTLVEVKNVSLVEDGLALFPDAPTARGRRHLELLADRARRGERAVMLFVVARADGKALAPAEAIDPAYAEALRRAAAAGVEVLARRARITPARIELGGAVPVRL
ncbi:MAG: DNA/RNA nuclease SfsA [Acidobacteria bacterium]|nr:MAG: DNA/RNA nuclease SfsA [Acidobacteriota bacterium]